MKPLGEAKQERGEIEIPLWKTETNTIDAVSKLTHYTIFKPILPLWNWEFCVLHCLKIQANNI